MYFNVYLAFYAFYTFSIYCPSNLWLNDFVRMAIKNLNFLKKKLFKLKKYGGCDEKRFEINQLKYFLNLRFNEHKFN